MMIVKLRRTLIVYIYKICFRYKVEVTGKSLPVLTNLDKGRYGVIVFENYNKYLQMDNWNRELLDKYCREYSVGIIGKTFFEIFVVFNWINDLGRKKTTMICTKIECLLR